MKKLLALFLALTLLLCAGCGSKSEASSMEGAVAPSEAPKEFAAGSAGYGGALNDYSADYDMEEPEPSPEEAVESGGEAAEAQKTVNPAEKIIYSASITVETLDFDASAASLEKLAASLGGFVESSQVSGNTRRQSDGTTLVVDRWAYYVLRVPANRFQEALHQAGSLGSVTDSSTSAENITSQFTDQEARKHSLEVQEERLLSMLEQAEDVDTLVILESRLSEVRYEIESIERTLRNWQNEVDYSTVSVSLQEVAVYTPTVPVQRSFGQRLGSAFASGWSSFVEFLEDFALWLAEALPMLVLLAAVILLLLFLTRGVRRRLAARKTAAVSATREKKWLRRRKREPKDGSMPEDNETDA